MWTIPGFIEICTLGDPRLGDRISEAEVEE